MIDEKGHEFKYCKTVGCDRKIYKLRNSTLYPDKYCPNCQLKAAVKKSKDPKVNTTRKSNKKSQKTKLMEEADNWFSRYIRITHRISIDTDGECIGRCYTCGTIKRSKNLQNGHFQRRQFKTTRYHLNDCRPQCYKCNVVLSGQFEIFEINLIKEIGQLKVDELKKLSQEDGEDNIIFYQEMIAKFKPKVEKLITDLNIKKWWR